MLGPEKLPARVIAALLIVSLVALPRVSANPQGAQVRQGQVRIDDRPGQLRIHQQSQRAVIDWQSFSIGAGETTRFIQPNSSAAALNRVRGDSASQIEGMLRANGRVYLINPNGILIGPGGRIDVGGFVASTLDTSDAAFERGGSLRFSGNSDAAIINLGSISALDGDVVLMAGSVTNAGTIRAPRGTAALAAGNDILLAESGDERVFVRGSGGAAKANGVTNSGNIEANIAELKAHGGNVYGMAVKNEGRIAATGVTRQGGQIFLSAGGGKIRSTGTLKARQSDGSGGKVKVDSGTTGKTEIGGTVDTSGAKGGEIVVLGNEIEVFEGTLILNDGETMGGRTFIGGGRRGADPDLANAGTVTVGNGAFLSASARETGDAGEVIVFSDGSLFFDGAISARGGSLGGNGGFVELSGKRSVALSRLAGRIDLSAPAGDAGTFLYDPVNISILPGNPLGDIGSSPTSLNTLYAGDIADFLGSSGNLLVTTSAPGIDAGNITIDGAANITWSSSNNLSFFADNDFLMNGGAVIAATGAGGLSVEAARSIRIGPGSSISATGGGLSFVANPSGTVTGQFEGILLENGVSISSGTGLISLRGTGGRGSAAGNHGIQIESSAFISSTGGDIELTGTAGGGFEADPTQEGIVLSGDVTTTGAGKITISGTGGNGTSGNLGVNIFGNVLVSTEAGDLTINGWGGGGTNSAGVQIADFGDSSASVTSTSGTIKIFGDGSAGTNRGIYVFGFGASIGGGTGEIILESIGDTILSNGASIESMDAGPISLTATRGISIGGGGIYSVDGNISLSANEQSIPTTGGFVGIDILGSAVETTGTGNILASARAENGGIVIGSSSTIRSNGGNIEIAGRATAGDHNGLAIDSSTITANGGRLLLIGEGSGTGNAIHSTTSSASVGSGTDQVIFESSGGPVWFQGTVTADWLILSDQSGTSAVDFNLGNFFNNSARISALGSGESGAVGSLFYLDWDDLEISDYLESGGIQAAGDVSIDAGGSLYVYASVGSLGGAIDLGGFDAYVESPIFNQGTGSITVTADRSLSVYYADIESVDGDIQLTANPFPEYEPGTFVGIGLHESTLTTLGAGSIRIHGNGGLEGDFGEESLAAPAFFGEEPEGGGEGEGPSFGDVGVLVEDNVALQTQGTGSIEIIGNGGDRSDLSVGIWFAGAGSSATTAAGNLNLTGTGGGQADGAMNRGIWINDALLRTDGNGNLTLNGSGGLGNDQIDGVQIGNGAVLEVNEGSLSISGTAGGTLGIGVMVTDNAGDLRVTGAGTMNSIMITGTGSSAAGVSLGNPTARVGSASPIGTNIEVRSNSGNVFINRPVTTGGSVLLSGPSNLHVNAPIDGGAAGVDLDATNITVLSQVTSTGGEVKLRFGQSTQSGTAIVNVLPSGTATSYWGRGPNDSLDFSGLPSPSSIGLGQLHTVENVIGNGLTGSTVHGLAAGSSFTISGTNTFSATGTTFTNFSNIVGKAGDDHFFFTGDGSIAGGINGGAGDNRFDYSGYGTEVVVDLASGAATGLGAGYTGIQEIVGSSFGDTVFGPIAPTTFEFFGVDQFQAGTTNLHSFENVNAGPFADRFVILPGASLTGLLDGGGAPGSAYDTLDYSLYGSEVEVNLGFLPHAVGNGLPGGFRSVENFVGSSASTDRFVGNNFSAIYRITGANAFETLSTRATGFENLSGGTETDIFFMTPGASLSGNLEGGSGTGIDSLNYALFDRPVSVFIGPNTATGLGTFSGMEKVRGSRFNDRFIYLNQVTIGEVDGGPGDDTVVIDDRDLGGTNVYNITAGGISRNPSYPISNIESVRLYLGDGGNTVNSGFYRFGQVLRGGAGSDELNLPGVTSLEGGNRIGNVQHSGFESPRPLDTGDILKQEVDGNDNDQGTGDGDQFDNRNNPFDPALLSSQIGAIGGAFSAAIVAQSVVVAIDGNSYLVFHPISLDGSGISPSNLAINALQQSLGVDANLELAAAIGYGGPIFLFNPDGPYALDLSGAPVDAALLAELQGNFSLEAITELSQALGLAVSIAINLNDGVVSISLDGGVPGQQVNLVLAAQLDDASLAELNAALGL